MIRRRKETTHIVVHSCLSQEPMGAIELNNKAKAGTHPLIQYHYVIRKSGIIERGRSELYKSNHCQNPGRTKIQPKFNDVSLGIILEGHHDQETWTDEQLLSFINLFLDINKAYNIPPYRVVGHNEISYSRTGKHRRRTCPGNMVDMFYVRHKLEWALMEAKKLN